MCKLMMNLAAIPLTLWLIGCGSSVGGGSPPPPPTITSVTVTATPSSITNAPGQTATCLGTVQYSNGSTTNEVSYSATGGTITSSGVFTPTAAPEIGTCTATATADSSKFSAPANITVTMVPPVVTGITVVASPTSITNAPGQTATCTATVQGTGAYTSNVTWTATGGTITPDGVFTPTGTKAETATCVANSAQPGYTNISGSASITVTLPPPPPIVLTSISPSLTWSVGLPNFFGQVDLHGSGFADGQEPICIPDPNIQFSSLISSTEAQVDLLFDDQHQGSGDRSCKVCKNDGTGCSVSAWFGLYGPNGGAVAKNGERFVVNPQEVVAGKEGNGYVDKFTADGKPDGNFYVGAPMCCIAVDSDGPNATGFVMVGGRIYDQNGNDILIEPVGYKVGTITGVFAFNGIGCILQSTINNLGCLDMTGGVNATPQVININVGNSPQPITVGPCGTKVCAYVLSIGGTPLLRKADVTSTADPVSVQVNGITTGAPGGSGIALVSSTVIVVSYGDKKAFFFDATTLKQTLNDVTLPGAPINVTADLVDGLVIVGNATNPGGTFTEIDPATGSVTALASTVPMMPSSMMVSPAGGSVMTCSPAGECVTTTLPK